MEHHHAIRWHAVAISHPAADLVGIDEPHIGENVFENRAGDADMAGVAQAKEQHQRVARGSRTQVLKMNRGGVVKEDGDVVVEGVRARDVLASLDPSLAKMRGHWARHPPRTQIHLVPAFDKRFGQFQNDGCLRLHNLRRSTWKTGFSFVGEAIHTRRLHQDKCRSAKHFRHSPPGRVGLSGPERETRRRTLFCRTAFPDPPRAFEARPSREREGKAY